MIVWSLIILTHNRLRYLYLYYRVSLKKNSKAGIETFNLIFFNLIHIFGSLLYPLFWFNYSLYFDNNYNCFVFSLFKRATESRSTVHFRKKYRTVLSFHSDWSILLLLLINVTVCLYPVKEVDCNYQSLSSLSILPFFLFRPTLRPCSPAFTFLPFFH